jgi:hypothetical protein
MRDKGDMNSTGAEKEMKRQVSLAAHRKVIRHACHTRTMGHGSAVVYRLRAEKAWRASAPESRYSPAGSVRILVQLLIAATSPVFRLRQKSAFGKDKASGPWIESQ